MPTLCLDKSIVSPLRRRWAKSVYTFGRMTGDFYVPLRSRGSGTDTDSPAAPAGIQYPHEHFSPEPALSFLALIKPSLNREARQAELARPQTARKRDLKEKVTIVSSAIIFHHGINMNYDSSATSSIDCLNKETMCHCSTTPIFLFLPICLR